MNIADVIISKQTANKSIVRTDSNDSATEIYQYTDTSVSATVSIVRNKNNAHKNISCASYSVCLYCYRTVAVCAVAITKCILPIILLQMAIKHIVYS